MGIDLRDIEESSKIQMKTQQNKIKNSFAIHIFNPVTEMMEERREFKLLGFIRESCTILYGCSLAPFASCR